MIGEDIRVEEIIADQIYKFDNKKNIRSKLAFPNVIALLCREAKVKIPGDTLISQLSGIDAEAMARISFLCYSNQMANEQMLFPYQNTARRMKEMEMQGIPVTMANLTIHRQREKEMNQERMRHNHTIQEVAAEKAREANKGKARDMEVDSDEEASSESEEW
ncbi:hypothetical protein PIB30_028193 [Stylosanthes scabra]|uniref:Uncharacterized protein n=1 Tax=Stylosanthes scabra TaxID=79078 RepID=A0ABU6RBE5_9FABA|nr:hypothetical protein [Stylosanthes scabra]